MTNPGPQGGRRPDSRQAGRRSHLAWLLPLFAAVSTAQVVLAGCGLVHAAQPGPGKGTSAGESRQSTSAAASRAPASWRLPQEAAFGSYALNSYLTGQQVIVAGGQAITSYDQRDGTLLWQVKPPPAPGYSGDSPPVFCGASSALSGATLNVAFGPGGQCALIAAIDVSTGRVTWTARLLLPDVAVGTTLDSVLVEAVGSAVVVGFNDQVGAFSAADGRFLGWHFTLTRRDPQYAQADDCTVTDLLSAGDARHAYFTDRCLLSGVVQYGVIDAAAATLRGDNVMPGSVAFKVDRAELVSAAPLVILLRADGLTRGEYLFFGSGTRLAAKLPSGQLSVSPDNLGLPPGDFHQRWRSITVGRTLLTVTDARADQADKLVAIDMATGATRWSSSLGGVHFFLPFAVDRGQVLVAAVPQAGSGALEIARVDPASGKILSAKASVRAELTGNPNLALATQFNWGNGQVFGVRSADSVLYRHITGPAAFAFG